MTLKDDPLVLCGWSCPYCGNPTKLFEDSQIYGRSYGSKCYVCEPCGAWVGCHKGTNKSLGRVANKKLRELKHQAHEAFDPIWKEGYMPRIGAYEILSIAFDLPTEQTHIGMFDEDMCHKVISLSHIIYKYFKSNGKSNWIGQVPHHWVYCRRHCMLPAVTPGFATIIVTKDLWA